MFQHLAEEKWRSFFAIEINEEIRNTAADIIQQLRQQPHKSNVKWALIKNLHITLRFLGEIEPAQITKCVEYVSQSLANLSAFTLQFSKLISFPISRPHVIAMGITLTAELANLYKAVEQSVLMAGLKPEQRLFLPHLTLGRIQSFRPISLIESNQLLPKTQIVTSITLFRSQLTSSGSIYTPLQYFNLTGK